MTSANGAPGGGIGVNVGRGAKVEDATGANAVWANEVVGVLVGVAAVVVMAVEIVDCVSVAMGSFVGVSVMGEVVTLEVGVFAKGVLVNGMLTKPFCKSVASCASG